jgi:hypothetical protein
MRCVNQRQLLPFPETALPIKKTFVRTSVHSPRMDISYDATTCTGLRIIGDSQAVAATHFPSP